MEDSVKKENRSVASRFKPSMVIWPILFGLIGVGVMLWREMRQGIPDEPITLADHWWVFAILLVLFTLLKDFSGMYRMRVMSGAPLKLSQLFRIRMLYEFTSAVTPSVAGGSSLEVVFIHREGIKISRATSMTIMALFLDELLMILIFLFLLLCIPYGELFSVNGSFQHAYLWPFIIGFLMKLVWVTLLFIGLFLKPSVFVSIIGFVFRLKWLKRFRMRGLRTAIEIRQCAQEIRHASFGYWVRVIAATIGIWGFRFMLANMAIMIFNPMSGADNLMCFARQYILNIVCMIVPTPGGSGFVELMFGDYLSEFISQKMSTMLITPIWRICTYYYYLIAGVIILPQWLGKSKLLKKKS